MKYVLLGTLSPEWAFRHGARLLGDKQTLFVRSCQDRS